jgi:hypothetical protein
LHERVQWIRLFRLPPNKYATFTATLDSVSLFTPARIWTTGKHKSGKENLLPRVKQALTGAGLAFLRGGSKSFKESINASRGSTSPAPAAVGAATAGAEEAGAEVAPGEGCKELMYASSGSVVVAAADGLGSLKEASKADIIESVSAGAA